MAAADAVGVPQKPEGVRSPCVRLGQREGGRPLRKAPTVAGDKDVRYLKRVHAALLIQIPIKHRVGAVASHVGEDPVRILVRREPDGVPDAPCRLRIDAIVITGDDTVEDPAARIDRIEVQVVVGVLSGFAVELAAVGAAHGLVIVAFGIHRLRRAS